LPANYTFRLYRNNTLVATSQNAGTSNEAINFTATAATYYARVTGVSGANNTNNCYTLRVAKGTASSPEISDPFVKGNVFVFPNPADDILNVQIKGLIVKANIMVYDVDGRTVMQQQTNQSITPLKVNTLSKGIYLIKINDINDNTIYHSKFVKE
jgi:hypothetical protein